MLDLDDGLCCTASLQDSVDFFDVLFGDLNGHSIPLHSIALRTLLLNLCPGAIDLQIGLKLKFYRICVRILGTSGTHDIVLHPTERRGFLRNTC